LTSECLPPTFGRWRHPWPQRFDTVSSRAVSYLVTRRLIYRGILARRLFLFCVSL